VQTFLPYPSFERSARVLDRRRLGRQRVEALQILNALTDPSYAWQHHPAVLQWRGYEEALVRYGLTMCEEWTGRGFDDTVAGTLRTTARDRLGLQRIRTQATLADADRLPPWLGRRAYHRSHQSSLVRKDPDHYRPHFPKVPDDLDYVWPVRIERRR
jgi:hypothetical protein